MIVLPISKLLRKLSVNRLQLNIYFCTNHSHKMTVDPIHMAYTAYEAISPLSENETPIILLHGILGSKTNWNSMSRQIALKTLRKVVAVDLRNHGDSPHTKEFSYTHITEDLKHIMYELNIEEASLIGHSLGGRAVMAFALKYPQLTRDLIVVDISPVSTSTSFNDLPNVLLAMKNVKFPTTVMTIGKAREEADAQLKSVIKHKHLRNFLLLNLAYHEKQKKFYWKVNLQTLMDKFQLFSKFDYSGVFDKPTLFIAGAKSDYMLKQDEPPILKTFPKAKFVYIKDAGHLIHAEKPEAFLNTVSTFLGRQS